MTITHIELCDDCLRKNPSVFLREIGQRVQTDGESGYTSYTFSQCQKCGSVWVKVEEVGGRRGEATYHHLLTERYF
jgi:hypothetical protein